MNGQQILPNTLAVLSKVSSAIS